MEFKTKQDIVEDWLPRYTGEKLENFGKYILLCNFSHYVDLFARWQNVPVKGIDKPMQCATSEGITIINFGMGSASAATIMDLLSAIRPKGVLFLGKCGCLKNSIPVGELILPLAGIRGDGASNDYFPIEVPALPAFALQKAISNTIVDYDKDYYTGTCYSTNRRVWEHDEKFKKYLEEIRALAVDMETSTIFAVGFYNHIPTGALLLVSDRPLIAEGIKTSESDKEVTKEYVDTHLRIGIDSMKHLLNEGVSVKHLKF